MELQRHEENVVPPDLFVQGMPRDSLPASESQVLPQPTEPENLPQHLSVNPDNNDYSIPADSQVRSSSTTPTQGQSTFPSDAPGENVPERAGDQTPLPPLPGSDSGDSASLFDAQSTFEENFGYPADEDNDLLDSIPSMYRLLNLLYETGSGGQGGLVEKIIIDQQSLGLLLNRMLPGSYHSVSKIDFKALDQLTIKPLGIYGSRPEIAKFLCAIGCIDDNTVYALSRPDESRESAAPTLRSGLYLVLPPDQVVRDDQAYDACIIYWPEDTTWYDNANLSTQRNRVTFMRYLTQLTDQILALVSADQAASFTWQSGTRNAEASSMHLEDDEDEDSRMFSFEVSKSEEQEEDVTGVPGFKVDIPAKLVSKKYIELVGGEMTAGLLLSWIEEPRRISRRFDEPYFACRLRSLLNSDNVVLCNKLNPDQLRILMEHGLRDKYYHLFSAYDTALAEVERRHTEALENAFSAIQQQLDNERPEIERQIRNVTKRRAREFQVHTTDKPVPSQEAYHVDGRKYPFIAQLDQKFQAREPMAHVKNDLFQELKIKIGIIRHIFESKETTEAEKRTVVNRVIKERCEDLVGENPENKILAVIRGIFDTVLHVTGIRSDSSSKGKTWNKTSDLDFLNELPKLVHRYPILFELGERVISSLKSFLAAGEDRFVEINFQKALADARGVQEDHTRSSLESYHKKVRADLWTSLWSDVYGAMEHTSRMRPRESPIIHVKSVIPSQRRDKRSTGEPFTVETTHVFRAPKQTHYSFYPFELTREDIQHCQNDNEFVPQPRIQATAQLEFQLVDGSSIEFIQVVQDKCLLIVASPLDISVFMNGNSEIGYALGAHGHKIKFSRDHLGNQRIYAYDEITRSFALHYENNGPKVAWYAFDEKFLSLKRQGIISLQGWYESTVQVQAICFVAGTAELCLISSSGYARVLSLVSEQFGPAELQVDGSIRSACSAPDGSCLFVTVEDPKTAGTKLHAFHWASFGEAEGFNPAHVEAGSSYVIASFESRSRIHLVSTELSRPRQVSSTSLRVKQKSTDFDFKSKEGRSQTVNKDTINNCLIDCHMEVWLRFPVLPAVPRNTLLASVRQPRSITFVTEHQFSEAKEYFTKMVATFERTTQKPTDGKLFGVIVQWSSSSAETVARQTSVSAFHFGAFIVELLCLIPIHLAVTRENRFIPLKDGILSPAFQRKLLGADVSTIINSISIGWYESLFQSYMATKPVRVVSSMGEQSVGKSYCLNHFADTSFAGSAMRTTEGVWLSCTPTDDYLLVSLDFEGVQSIERSAQEDTLLVLFNAAMSNMVLFRNNFAVSRNIASLFKSFQSSAMVLDPQLNPGLFNSDLAIIIKDVIGSDSKEIVREFSQKFKTIVREEKGQNFMTRLHRGQVHIIPWPVIKSRGFYTLFQRIRGTLEAQALTHGGGGVFLHTLKTLMAKIQANDWGALDKNLASHRAQQLADWLTDAISQGRIELGPGIWSQMKNIDTDQEVPFKSPASNSVFWVPSVREETPVELNLDETASEDALGMLILKFSSELHARHMTHEAEYLTGLQKLLYSQLDERVEQVRAWINVNIKRFPQENQDIRNLVKTLENTVVTARAALQLCGSKCSTCHLLCLRPHRHSTRDGHDCKTDHSCFACCDVVERHSESAPCGLLAGHDGRHLCETGKHTCGQVCTLERRAGCAYTCVKEIQHEGDHLCSARIHFCGEPCDLQNAVQGAGGGRTYNCPGLCQTPWDQAHGRHACANSQSCPIECQLCPRLCCNTDHFHGVDTAPVHLCGQAHSCTMLCEAPGICQIETQPSAILEQFTGRYEAFQYTRYAQEKRRLSCVVPIAPREVAHEGLHTHSTAGVVFHFCDVQCPRCKYYCTLPLGHPQQLHDTSHGSMTETQWFMKGPTRSASYELQDHKYGSGDQGSTVLCSMVCTQQGRHVHVDYCRSTNAEDCGGEEYQHINEGLHLRPPVPKDWISHQLYWARSGFKDPYSQNEKRDFGKCDAYCADPEHGATATSPANPSYCKLPILHAPMAPDSDLRSGYISQDGHLFDCKNPAEGQQNYHIVFVIDSSSSMRGPDRQPLPNTPISRQLRTHCDNRYGAVLSALYSFWKSREPSEGGSTSRENRSSLPQRLDAYSIITFNCSATTRISNNLSSTTEELIDNLISHGPSGGTSFAAAIQEAQDVLRRHWSDERAPVLIFLSDGESSVEDQQVRNLCQLCIDRGAPLAFYAISFGTEMNSNPLRQMTNVARDVYRTAQGVGRDNPCAYTNEISSVQLAKRFLHIANSLQKPRAALIGSSNNRSQTLM